MSDGTKIEWTDATWNPITGCSVLSNGCKHCYAMKLAGGRLKHHHSRAGLTVDTKNGPVWNGQVRFNGAWLVQPLHWKKPRMIFVCAHSDLFYGVVPEEWIDRVFAVIGLAYVMGLGHSFQILTKRPQRMRDYLSDPATVDRITRLMKELGPELPGENSPPTWPLPNAWIGVSVEDQAAADERIPLLLETPAAVRWVSMEPLLGKVDLRYITHHTTGMEGDGNRWALNLNALSGFKATSMCSAVDGPRLDWVVVGGESGPAARPMNPAWSRSLRDQCAAAGVPFLFKQWGEWAPNWFNDDAGQKIAGSEWMDKIGKKAAGRLLDGVQHDGYPGARA